MSYHLNLQDDLINFDLIFHEIKEFHKYLNDLTV